MNNKYELISRLRGYPYQYWFQTIENEPIMKMIDFGERLKTRRPLMVKNRKALGSANPYEIIATREQAALKEAEDYHYNPTTPYHISGVLRRM